MATTIYMNLKAGAGGGRPADMDAHALIESLGFRRVGPMPSTHISYARHREVDGIDTLDSITCGSYLRGGRAGEISSIHANYSAESGASHDGVTILQQQGKSVPEIFRFHSLRLPELEEELKAHFDVVHRD